MDEIRNALLSDLVIFDYRNASILESYQLDFCCNGKRSLEQACREKKIDLEQVVSELQTATLEKASPELISFAEFSPGQLIRYIVSTHHSYVKKELPVICGYLTKVASKHGERNPELKKIKELFEAVREEMEQHLQKEEQVLFPRINEMEKQAVTGLHSKINETYLTAPITMMIQEHEHAGSYMEEIRILSNQYSAPSNACTTYHLCYAALKAFELDLHKHVHLENNLLFPKALLLFKATGFTLLN